MEQGGTECPGIIPDNLRAVMDAQVFKDENDWRAEPEGGVGYFRYCPIRFLAYLERFSAGSNGAPPDLLDNMEQTPEKKFERLLGLGMAKYTYFAKGLTTGRIKIGKSRDPETRISQLQYSNNGERAVAMVILRGGHLERRYHAVFNQWLDGYEWFAPHPSIFAEIERLRSLTPPCSI